MFTCRFTAEGSGKPLLKGIFTLWPTVVDLMASIEISDYSTDQWSSYMNSFWRVDFLLALQIFEGTTLYLLFLDDKLQLLGSLGQFALPDGYLAYLVVLENENFIQVTYFVNLALKHHSKIA